jgi:hypothetical protein
LRFALRNGGDEPRFLLLFYDSAIKESSLKITVLFLPSRIFLPLSHPPSPSPLPSSPSATPVSSTSSSAAASFDLLRRSFLQAAREANEGIAPKKHSMSGIF